MSELLRRLRRKEKSQTLLYRGLASDAEQVGNDELVDRLNGLHADEQHHLSRLTARLLELGIPLESLDEVERPTAVLEDWEATVRQRELEEIEAYEAALVVAGEDRITRGILEEILACERQHEKNLAGKWMPA